MSDFNQIYVAIYFNDPESAKALSAKIAFPGVQVHFIINQILEDFIKELKSSPRIDLIVVEEDLEACSSHDLIRKMKISDRYKKTVTVLSVKDLSDISTGALELKADFLIETIFDSREFLPKFEKILRRRIIGTIPKNYNVLVLDDNHAILEIITMHLEEMDHKKFDLCTSIAEAKTKLREKEYNILLLDWDLNDGTCLDLIDFIKQDPNSNVRKNQKALSMVITGRDCVEDIMTLLQYGVEDQIIKPFAFEEFQDKLEYILEKFRKKGANALL